MDAGIFGVGIDGNQPVRPQRVDLHGPSGFGSKVSQVASMGDLVV